MDPPMQANVLKLASNYQWRKIWGAKRTPLLTCTLHQVVFTQLPWRKSKVATADGPTVQESAEVSSLDG